jgi:hypothetical protein
VYTASWTKSLLFTNANAVKTWSAKLLPAVCLSFNDYVRTNPDVMARIKEGIDNKQSNIDIYETMVLKDPENVPRDHQQILSKRYHDKQKDKHTAGSNLADQTNVFLPFTCFSTQY